LIRPFPSKPYRGKKRRIPFRKHIETHYVFYLLQEDMNNNKRLNMLYLQISSDRYHFLKFILEGYDGMGILSSETNGVVVIRYPREIYKELVQLISSIGTKIRRPIYLEHTLAQ
jgi:hypothetical protein